MLHGVANSCALLRMNVWTFLQVDGGDAQRLEA
jgi:hypothetical protein